MTIFKTSRELTGSIDHRTCNLNTFLNLKVHTFLIKKFAFYKHIKKVTSLPQEEFQLRVEEAQQSSASGDFRMTVVDHLSLVAQVFPVDALGACG